MAVGLEHMDRVVGTICTVGRTTIPCSSSVTAEPLTIRLYERMRDETKIIFHKRDSHLTLPFAMFTFLPYPLRHFPPIFGHRERERQETTRLRNKTRQETLRTEQSYPLRWQKHHIESPLSRSPNSRSSLHSHRFSSSSSSRLLVQLLCLLGSYDWVDFQYFFPDLFFDVLDGSSGRSFGVFGCSQGRFEAFALVVRMGDGVRWVVSFGTVRRRRKPLSYSPRSSRGHLGSS